MQGDFHIGPKGPAPCKAKTPGGCPFGGSNEHFDTLEGATENHYGHLAVSFTKNGAPKPEVDHNKAKFGFIKLDEGSTLEKKNKGEFAEAYALDGLVSNNKLHFAYGTEPFTVTAVQAKNHVYSINPDDPDDIVVQPPDGSVYSVSRQDDEALEYTRDQIQAGGGVRREGSAFSSSHIQYRMTSMGFTNGRVPKSPSESKSDLSAWDENGQEHRISVKSYMGSNPALASASKASEMTYSSSLPEGMSDGEAQTIVDETKDMSTQERVKHLKRKGITFDPDSGEPTHDKFKRNLDSLNSEGTAQKAYSRGLFTVADSNTEMSDDLKEDYSRTLGAFSRRMRYTDVEPKGREVTDHMSISRTGMMSINSFKSDEEAGAYYTKRARFSEPAKGKFPSGDVEVKDGRAVLRLNSNISISEVPR